jgi:hypothetical protein
VIPKCYWHSLWEFGTKCDGERIRGGLILFCHLTLRFIVTFLFARNITFSEKKACHGRFPFYLVPYNTKLRHDAYLLNLTQLKACRSRNLNSKDNPASQKGIFVKTVCRYLQSIFEEQ